VTKKVLGIGKDSDKPLQQAAAAPQAGRDAAATAPGPEQPPPRAAEPEPPPGPVLREEAPAVRSDAVPIPPDDAPLT